ncbi:hypothetical protein Tco_0324581 [Tanacetum coccineum]
MGSRTLTYLITGKIRNTRAYQEKDSRLGYFVKQIARASAKKETRSSLEKVPSWLPNGVLLGRGKSEVKN